MGQHQQIAIAEAIADLMTSGEKGETLCCTLDTHDGEGNEVSVQVMQDSINISPYAYSDDPLERLETCGALEDLEDLDLDLVDWEAGTYATIGIEELELVDVAQLVDKVFIKLLGCDENYSPSASTEDLG
jgi:hypothetical protein